MTPMLRDADPISLYGFGRDFLIAFAVFVLMLAWFSVGPSVAFPFPPPAELAAYGEYEAGWQAFVPVLRTELPALGPTFAGPGPVSVALLGMASSALFAANLALVRHLRHAYLTARS